MRRLRSGEDASLSFYYSNEVNKNHEEWSCQDDDENDDDNENINMQNHLLSRNYKKVRVLKRGSQGVIYLANKTKSDDKNAVIAIKRMFNDQQEEKLRGVSESILREIGILRLVRESSSSSLNEKQNNNTNHNIIRFLDVAFTSRNTLTSEICLVVEACLDGDVSSGLLQNFSSSSSSFSSSPFSSSAVLPIETILLVAYDTLHALDFLHNTIRCIHRDIKPSNLLLRRMTTSHDEEEDGIEIALADFGSARFICCQNNNEEDREHLFININSPGARRTTLSYRPPEILLGQRNYGPAVDIWGVGMVMLELFRGSHLFQTNSEMQMISQLFTVFGHPNKTSWPESNDFPILKSFFWGGGATSDDDDGSTKTNLRTHLQHWNKEKRQAKTENDDSELLLLFFDLIENMMRLNPATRLGARECLCHPVFDRFSGNSSSNDYQISLRRGLKEQISQYKKQQQLFSSSDGQPKPPLPPPPVRFQLGGALRLEDDDEE